jgi:drug/metabolite transporter (DMT)-like permease
MAVVAPTTAVCAVVIPVVAAVALGERPAAKTVAGIALALASIVLVSRTREAGHGSPGGSSVGLGLALLAGAGIGVFFLALARTAPAAGLWPLLAARAVSTAGFGLAAIAGASSLRMTGSVAAIVVAGGVLDALANALYLVATYHGPLYPASTVALALVVLRERLGLLQCAGLACALGAVLLIV